MKCCSCLFPEHKKIETPAPRSSPLFALESDPLLQPSRRGSQDETVTVQPRKSYGADSGRDTMSSTRSSRWSFGSRHLEPETLKPIPFMGEDLSLLGKSGQKAAETALLAFFKSAPTYLMIDIEPIGDSVTENHLTTPFSLHHMDISKLEFTLTPSTVHVERHKNQLHIATGTIVIEILQRQKADDPLVKLTPDLHEQVPLGDHAQKSVKIELGSPKLALNGATPNRLRLYDTKSVDKSVRYVFLRAAPLKPGEKMRRGSILCSEQTPKMQSPQNASKETVPEVDKAYEYTEGPGGNIIRRTDRLRNFIFGGNRGSMTSSVGDGYDRIGGDGSKRSTVVSGAFAEIDNDAEFVEVPL